MRRYTIYNRLTAVAAGLCLCWLFMACGEDRGGDLPDDGLFLQPGAALPAQAGRCLRLPDGCGHGLCFLDHHAPPPSPARPMRAEPGPCRRHTAVGRFQRPAAPPGPYSAVASSPVTSVRALAASVARSQINGRRVSSSMAVHSQPVYCTVCPFLVIFTVKLLIV